MTKTYRTQQGDTWDLISFKTLGDEHYVSQIMELNFQYRDQVIFSEGVILQIPEIDTSSEQEMDLPPWKR